MKTCPFCAEEIQDKAIKCRWCGEFINEEKIIKNHKKESNNAFVSEINKKNTQYNYIKIKRESVYADRFRSYKIILDDNVIAKIKNGQEIDLEIPKGYHKLYLKIDWCRSNHINFELKDDIIHFQCGSNLRGIRLFLAIFYITFFRNEYIFLKGLNNIRYIHPSVETVQVNLDGKIVEVPRRYKDLSEGQKKEVNKKVLPWKIIGLFFPFISFLRGRSFWSKFCFIFGITYGLTMLGIYLSGDFYSVYYYFNTARFLAAITIGGVFESIGLLVILILRMIIFFNLGERSYNRSKGNLHRVAYLGDLNNQGLIIKSEEELEVVKNLPIQQVEVDEKVETVKETVKVIDLYSLNKGNYDTKIIEKEIDYQFQNKNHKSDQTNSNNPMMKINEIVVVGILVTFGIVFFSNYQRKEKDIIEHISNDIVPTNKQCVHRGVAYDLPDNAHCNINKNTSSARDCKSGYVKNYERNGCVLVDNNTNDAQNNSNRAVELIKGDKIKELNQF